MPPMPPPTDILSERVESVKQYINELIHAEPFSFMFHGFFWSTLLIFLFPVAGWVLLITTLATALQNILNPKKIKIDAKRNKSDLAVYISGCDTGFGRDLTFSLASRGFTVFPGCLTEKGVSQYKGMDAIIPLLVDVTKDEDCANAASAISKWLIDSTAKSPRFLHAVVNNAGIGAAGLTDWTSVSTYQKVVDVNYYGAIRTTKAFLPILKDQSCIRSYGKGRIVNVGSIAGLFPGNIASSAYAGSKHALEAFSACLRLELADFGLYVTTINPSSHSTVMGLDSISLLKKAWSSISPEMREDYGEEYFSSLIDAVAKLKKVTWSQKFVEDALVSTIELLKPPPQVIVGMDAKYFVLLVRLLPMWLQVKVLAAMASKAVPLCMTKKK